MANVDFNVNEGFKQLDEKLTDFFAQKDHSVEVAFEIGNLHNEATVKYSQKYWNSTHVQVEDPVPTSLPPNKANDCSYFQQNQFKDALQTFMIFENGAWKIFLGCFLDPTAPNFQWFSLFMDPKAKMDLTKYSDMDLGNLLGTRPSDKWPKAGEILPGWDIGRGNWHVSSNGNPLTFTDGYFGITANMHTSNDGTKFIVRVFTFRNWDPPSPGNYNAGVP